MKATDPVRIIYEQLTRQYVYGRSRIWSSVPCRWQMPRSYTEDLRSSNPSNEENNMNRAIPLFLVTAALSLVAATTLNSAEFLWGNASGRGDKDIPWSDKRGDDVVPNERAVLAKLGEVAWRYAVSPTGHVTAIEVDPGQVRNFNELDLNAFATLSELETVFVIKAPANARAINWLTKLSRLTYLNLGWGTGDEHLAAIGKIPNLRELAVATGNASAAGVAQLANLHTLETLTLSGSAINDESLTGVAGLEKLTALDLFHSAVSDAGLKSIEGLLNLEVLRLPENITAAGLEHLQKLVKLRRLKALGRGGFGLPAIFTDRGAGLPPKPDRDRGTGPR